MNIKNNRILITGGGSGIGLALAKEFVRLNNKVIICGRNVETLQKAKKEIPELRVLPCDISDENSVALLVQQIQQKYPECNFLVNNAGIIGMWNVRKNYTNISEQKKEILTNVFGTIQVTQSFLPQLLKQKHSAVLNVSSALAFVPLSAAPVYSATKSAIHAYSVSIRHQLQNTPVKVFEVLPAAIDTQMAKDMEKIIGAEKSGPTMSPEKLARLIIRALQQDTLEIRPGLANLLFHMHRFLPSFAQKMMAKQSANILKQL